MTTPTFEVMDIVINKIIITRNAIFVRRGLSISDPYPVGYIPPFPNPDGAGAVSTLKTK